MIAKLGSLRILDMVVENSIKVGLHGVVLLRIALFVTCLSYA